MQKLPSWYLLRDQRFYPLFWAQFLGAFVDNLYKNALLVFLIYQNNGVTAPERNILLANLSAALFILPFFLFSTSAGLVADAYPKNLLMRWCKWAELLIIGLCLAGFYYNSVWLLLGSLFLLGTQATFLGPLKYGLLPELLEANELINGNAWVEAATYVAILGGTMTGAILMSLSTGVHWTAGILISASLTGIGLAYLIPQVPKATDHLSLYFNWFKETWTILKLSHRNDAVFNSILGISWFWLFGAVLLTQMPEYVRHVLKAGPISLSCVNTAFALGIGVGSLLCAYWSKDRLEVGLVPLGSLGLTLFALDFSFIQPAAIPNIQSLREFLSHASNWHVLFDLFALGVSGGLYSVPLYAVIQQRTPKSLRARIIAANNIINALFMVIGAFACWLWLAPPRTMNQMFWLIGIMNGFVAWYIYRLVPEFFMRFLVWLLVHAVYDVKADLKTIPEKGAGIVIANHVSFMDPLLLLGSSPRPIRFVMDHRIYHMPIMHFIFKEAKAIPIASEKEAPHIKQQAFDTIAEALNNGELIGFFPEGGITRSGEIMPFKSGIETIIERTPVPVIPVALRGLWGSFFSRRYGRAMAHWPKRWWRQSVELVSGPMLAASEVTSFKLHKIVQKLRGDKW